MFREMRRKKQQLPQSETVQIVNEATCAIVGVIGDEGYPYTFPISHVFDEANNKLYFHSAKSGHKIDAIKANSKVSFSIVGRDDVAPTEYTTYFKSVHGFGSAYIVEDNEERAKAFTLLAEKFCQEGMYRFDKIMTDEAPAAMVVAIDIEHMTGKEAIELTRMR
ncbi:MAG: pyridoxamine 5'-phosphate oxidase family protein [Firmicutes bacterium]|jgi:nitroimidazol reductase NimA-like FMN-containing flavoprotein (pyridoxamine 5'-phosphate oxidase superfamily)|nr:pyridoxamine 5'-phosphate oxidase family protein [Bacillota bacterium]